MDSSEVMNTVTADIGPDSDLMKIIHAEMENQKRLNSRSWECRVLHITSDQNYELKQSLDCFEINGWEEMTFKKKDGVILIKSITREMTKSYSEFVKLIDTEKMMIPTSGKELSRLWLDKKGKAAYKLDLEGDIVDNRIQLKDFNNPLRILCEKHNLALSGIQSAFYLIGAAGSSSPSHYEDNHMGSINKMLAGLAIWLVIHFEDNEKLINMLNLHFGEDCHALLASKIYLILPTKLKEWGVRHYMFLQKPGDIVATFPGAIHTVFNLELTVKEALNFIPVQWVQPVFDHEDCYCRVTRKRMPNMGSARLLQHGQSLKPILKNSWILESIDEWKLQNPEYLSASVTPVVSSSCLLEKHNLEGGESMDNTKPSVQSPMASYHDHLCNISRGDGDSLRCPLQPCFTSDCIANSGEQSNETNCTNASECCYGHQLYNTQINVTTQAQRISDLHAQQTEYQALQISAQQAQWSAIRQVQKQQTQWFAQLQQLKAQITQDSHSDIQTPINFNDYINLSNQIQSDQEAYASEVNASCIIDDSASPSKNRYDELTALDLPSAEPQPSLGEDALDTALTSLKCQRGDCNGGPSNPSISPRLKNSTTASNRILSKALSLEASVCLDWTSGNFPLKAGFYINPYFAALLRKERSKTHVVIKQILVTRRKIISTCKANVCARLQKYLKKLQLKQRKLLRARSNNGSQHSPQLILRELEDTRVSRAITTSTGKNQTMPLQKTMLEQKNNNPKKKRCEFICTEPTCKKLGQNYTSRKSLWNHNKTHLSHLCYECHPPVLYSRPDSLLRHQNGGKHKQSKSLLGVKGISTIVNRKLSKKSFDSKQQQAHAGPSTLL